MESHRVIQHDNIYGAGQLKKQGGFIPGIRPGKPTSDYLNKILNYIVFIGACGLIVIAVVPILASGLLNVSHISFSGTSLIIIVGVVLETTKTGGVLAYTFGPRTDQTCRELLALLTPFNELCLFQISGFE